MKMIKHDNNYYYYTFSTLVNINTHSAIHLLCGLCERYWIPNNLDIVRQ